MQTQEIEYTLEADGRIVLEGLPQRRGQCVKVLIQTNWEEQTPQPTRLTPEEIEANREKLRGSITFADDFDPAAPACDPMDWDANQP